jgi:hypothetical protein
LVEGYRNALHITQCQQHEALETATGGWGVYGIGARYNVVLLYKFAGHGVDEKYIKNFSGNPLKK